ncbi:kinase-like protein [Macrolepiota fuliginosa MF-IS2]|uniref:Kinase-like protein n=1 Tax=Macrolepiota fuliginosa MF-IS2 TaxID=1400762 RepID=A0A9P5X9D7_9AGAR|nr:kinase-like protein [Macrolepiota fuliginosa MF-IS2]
MFDEHLLRLIPSPQTQVLLRPDLPAWLRKHSRIVLYRLCSASMLYPQCYVLKGIVKEDSPEASGGFGDIYKGRLGDKKLCLKVVRLSKKSDVIPALKGLAKEGIVWGQLIHPHILPFYGIYYLEETYEQICLVSPWMNNSDLGTYLKRNPAVLRTPFIHDIANGLEYLHHEDVIHGDMKAANVLVSNSGKACITDFGLSSIPTDQTLAYTRGATTVVGCSFRWTAPELLEEGCRATPASDVWAFGCVCYEILFGELPFHKCTNDIQVMRMLDKGVSPFEPRPDIPIPEIDVDTWTLIESCCIREPKDRPSSPKLSQGLRQFSKVNEKDVSPQTTPEGLEFQNEMRSREGVSINLEMVKQMLNKLEVRPGPS